MNIKRILMWFMVLVFVVGFAGILISCEKRSKQEVKFEKALKKAIKSDKKTIDLKDLTDFEWEKVYSFGPYLTGVPVDIAKRVDPDYIEQIGLECVWHDAHWALFFIDSKNNTIPICIKRTIIDMGKSHACTTKNGTKGIFTEENWGSKERPVMRKVLSIQGEKCSDYNDLEKIMIKNRRIK